MSLCVAQDCANEGFASEPVLGAPFCFGHWNEAKSAFTKKNYTRKNKNPYGELKHDRKIYFLISDMYIKIGSSSDPLARVRLIRSGSDTGEKPGDVDFENLECIGWYSGTLRAEKRLHEQFDSYRAAGEYYNRTPELELEIRKLIYIGRRADS
jgi:hypothetical protein